MAQRRTKMGWEKNNNKTYWNAKPKFNEKNNVLESGGDKTKNTSIKEKHRHNDNKHMCREGDIPILFMVGKRDNQLFYADANLQT